MIYKTTPYELVRGDETLLFGSEKEACAFLGVKPCSVSSAYTKGIPCKGYKVFRKVSESRILYDKRLRKIWGSMHERCERKKHPHYKNYGGRGITVCKDWEEYVPFAKWAIESGYGCGLTIDRINNDFGYSPNNCRWASIKEQANNKRTNHVVRYHGAKYTISELADLAEIKYTTLKERIKAGWNIEDAVNRPVRKRRAKMDGGDEP